MTVAPWNTLTRTKLSLFVVYRTPFLGVPTVGVLISYLPHHSYLGTAVIAIVELAERFSVLISRLSTLFHFDVIFSVVLWHQCSLCEHPSSTCLAVITLTLIMQQCNVWLDKLYPKATSPRLAYGSRRSSWPSWSVGKRTASFNGTNNILSILVRNRLTLSSYTMETHLSIPQGVTSHHSWEPISQIRTGAATRLSALLLE